VKFNKYIALFLALTLIFSSVGTMVSGEENQATVDNKGWRNVGIHAQEDNVSPDKPSRLYLNEASNIYLSIDKPNKGEVINGERETHYDLNGYSVKFYYDDDFFRLNSETPDKPLNYKLPFDDNDGTEVEGGVIVPSEGSGYFPYKHGAYTVELEEMGGKKYQVVYATILFSGTWLPDKDVDWYNLCAVPVIPKKTGTTEVFVEVGTNDEYALELYSKNKPGEDRKNFEMSVINNGVHTIIIEDQPKPAAPKVTPSSGTYPEKQTITITAGEDCDIYYSLNGGAEEKYTGPFDITSDTTLVCYAKKTTGEFRESSRVTCKYIITAERPYLFKSDKETLVPDEYFTETDAFKVYFSDEDEYRTIPDGTIIYYTFRDDIEPSKPVETAGNPNDGWVAVATALPELLIEEPVKIRMFTDKQGVYSDVVSYSLGFAPVKVEVEDFNTGDLLPSGIYDNPLEIRLVSSPNAEIYYTIDGTSPLDTVNRYDDSEPLVISENTTLRAVAKLNGKFGPVMTNWYVINGDSDGYGVNAYYPPGKYEGEVTVVLTPENPDFTVWYKYDGDTEWKEYDPEQPIVITEDKTIIAHSTDGNGNANGKEYNFSYKIMPKSPIFSPESTQFKSANKVTVYSPESTNENTDSYSLYYTVDGTWPISRPTDGSEPELLDSPNVFKADDISDSVVIPVSGHTVITAVILKDGKTFSHVVQHTYDVTKQKPVKPVATLPEGVYVREIGTDEDFDFTTLFMPIPAGTEIYYTVNDKGEEFCPDPVPNTTTNGTTYYNKNNPVPIVIEGETIIKAVAVNRYGVKSDIVVFKYTVIPEAPKAAEGGTVAGVTLPVVPVKAVVGSEVVYKIGDFENRFVCTDEEFYIDTATGNAYADPNDLNSMLGQASGKTNTGSALLEIWSELDDVKSEPNYYLYKTSGVFDDLTTIAPPYADVPSGKYDEVAIDDENSLLVVHLDSINEDATIQYRLKDSTDWEDYNASDGVKIKNGDDVLYARCTRFNGTEQIFSETVSYTYIFYPIAPYISLDSGRYTLEDMKQADISLDVENNPHKPHSKYEIYHRQSGETTDYPLRYDNVFTVDVNETMSVKAYVKNTQTKRISPMATRYYIIEAEASGGAVEMEEPYYGKKRIALQLVTIAPWNEGIKLYTDNTEEGVEIKYTYTRILQDGTPVSSKVTVYDPASPIAVTSNTKSIQIEAWLVNENGEISGTRRVFNEIKFESFDAPLTSLEGKDTTQFSSGTTYTIDCDEEYKNDPTITRYYTVNGKDPVVYDSITGYPTINGILFTDDSEPLKLTADTTVKTVYRSACGDCEYCNHGNYDMCQQAIFGTIGTYRYTIKKSSGGGGGGGGGGGSSSGGTSSQTSSRRYTKDIFGQEHPTHIGYIYGYLDGSVKPEGHITREETAAILYRIRNKQYEKPFATTGTVFPDVARSRWSVTDIEYMASENVIMGYPDGEFKPTRNLSRAEFAALIYRFAQLEKTSKKNPFTDLKEKHWAYEAIMSLCDNGLMQGYGDGIFAPENEITRAEVMTVINKLLGRNPSESYVKTLGFNPFNDLKENKWYYVTVLEATITHDYYLDKSDVEIKWENWK